MGCLCLTLAGCGGEGGLFAPGRNPGVSGGGGGDALVGRWETTLVLDVPPDFQTWTTMWTFRSDRTCHYRQTVVSVLEGGARVKERDCEWRTANTVITVTWADTGAEEGLPFSFAALDPNRLLLQGIEYRRAP